jgi:hypothetical protein
MLDGIVTAFKETVKGGHNPSKLVLVLLTAYQSLIHIISKP